MENITKKWEKEMKAFLFNLPTIEGKLFFENNTIVYDPACLEIFEVDFDDYIANHPMGNSFSFKKEIIMKNMKETLESLQNQARLNHLYNEKHEKHYWTKGSLGTPERGYTYKVFLYPDWINFELGSNRLKNMNKKQYTGFIM